MSTTVKTGTISNTNLSPYPYASIEVKGVNKHHKQFNLAQTANVYIDYIDKLSHHSILQPPHQHIHKPSHHGIHRFMNQKYSHLDHIELRRHYQHQFDLHRMLHNLCNLTSYYVCIDRKIATFHKILRITTHLQKIYIISLLHDFR